MKHLPHTQQEQLRGWLDELAATGRARGTIALRASHIRRLLEFVAKPTAEVTRADIVAWFGSNQWGPQAKASARASVRLFFAWCLDAGLIEVDPAAKLPTVLIPRSVPMPAPEFAIMRALAVADARVALAIEIMAMLGLRRAEVAGLKAGDVVEHLDGYAVRVVGKGGHTRLVPCPPHLAARITRAGGYVFPGAIDGHISAAYLGRLVARVLPDGWTAHKLRHRYATRAYSSGHDLRAVQELLGHAKIETTRNYVGVSQASILESAAAAWRIAA
nr:MAG TPA: SITE SPECIFIC RECOMBINASE XERD [Bacteriophage sp.]